MKTLASLALAATAVAGVAHAQAQPRVADRYGPAPSRTLTRDSQTPAGRTAAERLAPPQVERRAEAPAPAPMRLAAAPIPSGRMLGWAGKTQSAVERLPEPQPAPQPAPARAYAPPRTADILPPAYDESAYAPPSRAYPAYEPPRREPALRSSAEADLPTSLYDAPRRDPVLRPRQSVEPVRRASAPPPRAVEPRPAEPYPIAAEPYRPEPQARRIAAPPPPAVEPAPVMARTAPAPEPRPAPAPASPIIAHVPKSPAPIVAQAPAAPARTLRLDGVPVPPSDPPRIASKYRVTPDVPVRSAEPAKPPARQAAAGPADFDLAPVPDKKPVKTAAVGKRAAEAPPPAVAPPAVGKQAPRLYSLHREYGMSPDAIPAPPKGDNYVLIAPPEEPKSDKDDEAEVKAGGVG